jgi:hypothetical protein
VLRIFIALKKSIALVRFEPATFGSSGQHTNRYTTKATHLAYTGYYSSFMERPYAVNSFRLQQPTWNEALALLLNTAILKQSCARITEHRHPETRLWPYY